MSTLVPAPRRRAHEPGLRQRLRAVKDPQAPAPLAVLLGVALFGAALLSTGGNALGPNTLLEVLLIGLGAFAAVSAVARRADPSGMLPVALFALLTGYTALSIAWSYSPDASWIETGRQVSYLALFGAAVAVAKLLPRRGASLVGGIALYATAISLYAALAKVFPVAFGTPGLIGRFLAPFSYWNATGVAAAIGLPATIYLASRETTRGRTLAFLTPALSLQLSVTILTLSRSAFLAAIVGLGVSLVLIPGRLRAVAQLAASLPGTLLLCAWGLPSAGLLGDKQPLSSRIAAGHTFGLLLLATLALGLAAGFLSARVGQRVQLSPSRRRTVSRTLLGLLALVPVAAVIAVSFSQRGLGGEVSHLWDSLTNTNAHVSDHVGRFAEVSSTRPLYWGQALRVGGDHRIVGVGELGWATARLPLANSQDEVGHAHGYLFQTFADLGIIGLLLNAVLLLAWVRCVARSVRSGAVPPAELHARRALLAVTTAFGLQSLIDWTWFIPGTALPVLLCAGYLCVDGVPARRPVRLLDHPGRAVASAGLVLAAIVLAFLVWQPQHARSLAYSDPRAAHAADPLALEPLYAMSALEAGQGHLVSARATLQQAINREPHNPDTWTQLALFDRAHGGLSRAVREIATAHAIAPANVAIYAYYLQFQTAARAAHVS